MVALMEKRGWKSNKPFVEQSGGRLSNGVMGRIRKEGENIKLSTLDELAKVLGVAPHVLVEPTQQEALVASGDFSGRLPDGRTWRDLFFEAAATHAEGKFLAEFAGYIDAAFNSVAGIQRANRHTHE